MKKGMIAAALSYFIWGMLPLYWKQIDTLAPLYILAMRIALSMILCVIIIVVLKKWGNVKQVFLNKKQLISSVAAGIIVSLNWFCYIWAVNSGHILDSSLGYYINPLMVAACGGWVFKEKIGKWEKISILLAAAGVSIMILRYGKVPWVALIIAATFTAYGALKKIAGLDTYTSLLIETGTVFPIALGYIIYSEFMGIGSIGILDLKGMMWLSLAGVVTAVPLFLYGSAVASIPLTTVGFFQYISPTMTLLLGVFIYGEEFTPAHGVTFAFIWVALIIYVLSKLGLLNGVKKEKPAANEL